MSEYAGKRSSAASESERPRERVRAAQGKRTLVEELPDAGARAPVQRSAQGAEGPAAGEPRGRSPDGARPALHELFMGHAQLRVARCAAGEQDAPRERSDRDAGVPQGPGEEMPREVRGKMESAFGSNLSSVRVHEDASAAALGARAYTRGTEVHFAPGEYQPHSQRGQELLGHELAHVMQQSRGVVQPTTQLRGNALNDSSALEREADRAGDMAARGERVPMASVAGPAPIDAPATAPVQRSIAIGEDTPPITLKEAQEIAATAPEDETAQLVDWYVRYLHEDHEPHTYLDKSAFLRGLEEFVETWKAGLRKLGFHDDPAHDEGAAPDGRSTPDDKSAPDGESAPDGKSAPDDPASRRGSQFDMAISDAFHVYNGADPKCAEALIYKLDKEYVFLKRRWVKESGISESDHFDRGAIYDPPGKHTMPKNFAWMATVIHRQLPVRVVAPIDYRVLVRKAINPGLAETLGIEGAQAGKEAGDENEKGKEKEKGKENEREKGVEKGDDVQSGDEPDGDEPDGDEPDGDEPDGEKKLKIEVPKKAVKKGDVDAPLSATAREILGFLRNGYYRVGTTINTDLRCETLLQPTGKALLDPSDIFIPASMSYKELRRELQQLGMTIQKDHRITDLRRAKQEDRRKRDAAWWAKARRYGGTAVAAAAVVGVAILSWEDLASMFG